MSNKRVLSVGQCFADHGSITRTLQRHFAAELVGVDDAPAALARLRTETFALVLVNRQLDLDGSAGLQIIKQIKGDEQLRHLPVMLVSNYEAAQNEAVAAGALAGFGKASLGQPHMLARLQPLLS
jgi:two-component system chemotaxis response regulator CheY